MIIYVIQFNLTIINGGISTGLVPLLPLIFKRPSIFKVHQFPLKKYFKVVSEKNYVIAKVGMNNI